MIKLKTFQETAISILRKQFLELWKTGNRKIPLIFKSPTGSGKTIMVSQFLKDLTGDPQFDVDKAYIWISFSEDSYLQSKKKLFDYYGGANEISLLDYNDLEEKIRLEKNNIFFINWQKIKASSKDGRKLRKENELSYGDDGIFDEFIKNTQEQEREIILIVDEAHRDTDTELADELINLINPRIILRITATPKEPSISDVLQKRVGYVEVNREEVIISGLIKEKIITQSKEDIDKIKLKEIDQDLLLLELATNKRLEIKKAYDELKLKINPIVLIQLPNDDKARKETEDKTKLDIVKDFLKSKGVDDVKIAIWLSEKKENLEDIEKNDSEVSFLIFKQAAATGWDCPRASILVMFREIKNPTFHTQTIGRILRMPQGKHYSKPELNIGYLYTNYQRNQITLPDGKYKGNKPFIFSSTRKEDIKPIILESMFLQRTDYNDLGDTFQQTFSQIADKYFNITRTDNHLKIKGKLIKKGIEIDDVKIENDLIVNAEIENYDNFVEEITQKGIDIAKETSKNDLVRMYNLLCFEMISNQEEENKKFAPERSWGKLKTALNVWFAKNTKEKREQYYKVIVKELLKDDSILKIIISSALEQYRPIRQKEVNKKASRAKNILTLEIPRANLSFTDDYEELKKVDNKKILKNSMEPFYFGKEYFGRKNEIEFIKYLEIKKRVQWWYKNGDQGSEHFAITYYDENDKKEKSFYPDWIIKLTNNKILIIDTKGTNTANPLDTKNKAEALQKWIKNKGANNIQGGISIKKSGIWKINNNDAYTYDSELKGWNLLDNMFK